MYIYKKMSAILYSRISKLSTGYGSNNHLSLESQDHENRKFILDNNLKIFKSLKEVGSSYLKKQYDLLKRLVLMIHSKVFGICLKKSEQVLLNLVHVNYQN